MISAPTKFNMLHSVKMVYRIVDSCYLLEILKNVVYSNYFLFLLHSPKYSKVVPGEGMPLSKDPTQKGNLIIQFDIKFPSKLTPAKRKLINRALHA